MNAPYGTPLTAPHVTTGGYADGKQLTKEGRHVGLDFYDLLIEALIHPWPLTGVADPEGIWPRHDEIRYRQVGWAPVNFQVACHPLAEGPRCVICSEFLPLPSRPSEKLGGD